MTRPERAARLRGQLAAAGRSGTGKPFPDPLRRAVVDYAEQALADGESVGAVSRALGLSAFTIQRWRKEWAGPAEGGAQMRRVEIVAEGRRATLVEQRCSWVVHTRGGLRIEGLSLQALTALVRAVG